MTSQAIMGNDTQSIFANKSNVSKKSESVHKKEDSFSKVMEKNKYENHDNRVNKHDKSDFHSSRPEVISNKHIHNTKYNKENNKPVGFVKEKFINKIENAINDVADAYKETLDISDEELMSIMENLAINIFQLPLQEFAKNIVLEANGEEDITALLVNENALNDLQSMNNFFENYNMNEKLDITVEELGNLVEEAIQNILTNKEQLMPKQDLESNQISMEGLNSDTVNLDSLNTENVSNTDNDFKVAQSKMSETIILDDGKEIKIEVVDVRENMTHMNDLENMSSQLADKVKHEDILTSNDMLDSKLVDTESMDNMIDNSLESKQDILLSKNDMTKIDDSMLDNSMKEIQNIDNEILVESLEENLDIVDDIQNTSLDKKTDINKSTSLIDDISNDKTSGNVAELNIEETDSKQEGTSSDNESHNNFKNDSHNETFYDKFITNLEKSYSFDEGSILKEVSHIKEMAEIVNQVVDKIKIHISKEATTMKLNLNPEHLGKVELQVTSKSGVLTADFVVENQTAKEALEKGLSALVEKFHEQGLKVEAIEVSIADYDFTRQDSEKRSSREYNQEDKKKKRSSKISMDDIAVEGEVIKEERQIMSNLGVDYTV